MSSSHLRSNNPFAQDVEDEIQAQISDPNGLSRQSSINISRPDPSILEDSSNENITIDGDANSTPPAIPSRPSQTNSNIPTIQIDQQPDSSNNIIDGNGLRRSSISSHNGTVPEWEQIDDSHPDAPPPAYSEVDPLSTPGSPNLQAQSPEDNNNIYQRPPGAPPLHPGSNNYERPSIPPPLNPRPSQLNTQFQPPSGPPPSHLSPSEYSPNLPPRPTSPRLPARPNAGRRNQFPGASGATYSNIGAPPLPQRRN